MKVADLDDEFAELVLGEHSENFDLVSADKVFFYKCLLALILRFWVILTLAHANYDFAVLSTKKKITPASVVN